MSRAIYEYLEEIVLNLDGSRFSGLPKVGFTVIMVRDNNNNDALLSQTWVIATVAVLEVCTVPHFEPHNVRGELDPCYSYSCCGRAR